MKLFYKLAFVFLMIAGCKENENFVAFDTSKSYLYFIRENQTVNNSDTIPFQNYSFAAEQDQVQQKRLAIPVKISGVPRQQDYEYQVVVDQLQSDLPEDCYHIEKPLFRAGNYVDTLFVLLKRSPLLKSKEFYLYLGLQENANFQLGDEANLRYRIKVSDRLIEPSWWKLYKNYFGTFYPEVYQQWIWTYTAGFDPSGNYWDNMPTYINDLPNSLPAMYYCMQKVKRYFAENVIYPDNDASKPRILLP